MYLHFIAYLTVRPTRFEIWFITKLAKLLGRHPLFDLGVESAIRHNVLGGLCFAACIFIFWMQGARPGGQRVRQRVLTILFGSSLAIVLSLLSAELASWLPPSRNPSLAHFYPPHLMENINSNSFPSQSTAVYAAVAAGIFSLHKVVGSALWVGVGLIVGLPRLYVGGRYLSDVLVGFRMDPADRGRVSRSSLDQEHPVTRLELMEVKRGQWIRRQKQTFRARDGGLRSW